MSIESLFDHMARVYKFSEASEDGTKAQRNYYTADALESIAIVPARFGSSDDGAGARKTGSTTVYLRAGADVARNDVLDVNIGPNSPQKLRIVSTPDSPRGNHIEAVVEPFTGVLTPVPA